MTPRRAAATITPDDTLRAAPNERPDVVSEQRWCDYNRKFNALLMGRESMPPQPPPPSRSGPMPGSSLADQHSRCVARPATTTAPHPKPDWSKVGALVLVGLGMLTVDVTVAASLDASLGMLGAALVGRGLVLLGWL